MLNDNQLRHLDNEGYLVVEDVIDPVTVLDPLVKEYDSILDNLASELYDKGENVIREIVNGK